MLPNGLLHINAVSTLVNIAPASRRILGALRTYCSAAEKYRIYHKRSLELPERAPVTIWG